jgi:GntP family gluconate:H+ symporter
MNGSMIDLWIFLGIIVLLVLAISRWKVHPFIALIVSGLLAGVSTGMSPVMVVESLLNGFGDTLKWIGVVIVFGTVIGEMLHETGGSQQIAGAIIRAMGPKRLPLAMGLTGYIVAIPVFVDVAYIMLQPVIESLAAQGKRKVLVIGLSLTAGLTATHALLPPTPGPLAAAGILEADIGKVILLNLLVAFFVTGGGLLWSTFYCKRVYLPYDRVLEERLRRTSTPEEKARSKPGTLLSLLPILLPLILIAMRSVAGSEEGGFFSRFIEFAGSPVIALLLGVMIALLLYRKKEGGKIVRLNRTIENSIIKAAAVIMITGAGGGFGAVLKNSDIVSTLPGMIESSGIPGMLLPFLLAAALTTSTGSLTVSMVTTASIMAPILGSMDISPELTVALTGAGSLCVIHTNSSFFWLLGKLHQVTPTILLRTLTLQSLIMGLSGLLGIAVLLLFGVT